MPVSRAMSPRVLPMIVTPKKSTNILLKIPCQTLTGVCHSRTVIPPPPVGDYDKRPAVRCINQGGCRAIGRGEGHPTGDRPGDDRMRNNRPSPPPLVKTPAHRC